MQANRWLIEMQTDEKVQVEKNLYSIGSNNTDLANRNQDEMNNCLSDMIIYPLSPLTLPHGSRSYSISRYLKTHTSMDVTKSQYQGTKSPLRVLILASVDSYQNFYFPLS